MTAGIASAWAARALYGTEHAIKWRSLCVKAVSTASGRCAGRLECLEHTTWANASMEHLPSSTPLSAVGHPDDQLRLTSNLCVKSPIPGIPLRGTPQRVAREAGAAAGPGSQPCLAQHSVVQAHLQAWMHTTTEAGAGIEQAARFGLCS